MAEYKDWKSDPDNAETMRQVAATNIPFDLKMILAGHVKSKHGGVEATSCHVCMLTRQRIIAIEENLAMK